MASTSTSSIEKKSFKYDVFISFRGEDTRKNFVDHLYYALVHKSIHTNYIDDERITRGKRISDDLITAIQDSRLYIIVFSKNYASSSWCLDELVQIMEECHKSTLHTAYPIFYDVEPTEIRKQSGPVGEAFSKHENQDPSAAKWRVALKEVADLAGFELKNTLDGHEAKFIEKIVEEISLELRFIDSSVDGKLIGIESRVKGVVSALETGTDDVRMIGIKGMGGSGKTTLARAEFDHTSGWFEGNSFKYDVFISFRGEDTRKNFVDHLYHALRHKSIRTYKDDERITKGKTISDELIMAIKDSRFYIVVFSKNYASSSWCLDELVQIMEECQKTTIHTAYPVFYDVEPTEIQNHSGSVAEAFSKHETQDAAAAKRRQALNEAADLAGFELKNTLDG
uniref:TMV resistance protein N-like n=1 Tax=Erigeron canadensis TaxID=72917 RepID=UPI001CB8D068|nr:TMV resistance protein N-like [Erigeron canadensis]